MLVANTSSPRDNITDHPLRSSTSDEEDEDMMTSSSPSQNSHKSSLSVTSTSSADSSSAKFVPTLTPTVSHPSATPVLQTPGPKRKRLSCTPLPVAPASSYFSPLSASQERPSPVPYYNAPSSAPSSVSSNHRPSGSTGSTGYTHARGGSHESHSSASGPAIHLGHAASPAESFLSELAAKERRLVELRDEYRRIKAEMEHAEYDLRACRERAARELYAAQSPMTHSARRQSEETPDSNELRRLSSPTPKPSAPASAAFSGLAGTLDEYPVRSTKSPTEKERSAAGLMDQVAQEHVMITGRRVAEELGSQLWGLFDDLKSITIGEEPRIHTSHQQQQHSDADHLSRAAQQPQPQKTPQMTLSQARPHRRTASKAQKISSRAFEEILEQQKRTGSIPEQEEATADKETPFPQKKYTPSFENPGSPSTGHPQSLNLTQPRVRPRKPSDSYFLM